MNRPDYRTAIEALGILKSLADCQPHVAGTPPLGLATDKSDIDILCQAADLSHFAQQVWSLYAGKDGFLMWQWTSNSHPVIASFMENGWVFEIFASHEPVDAQPGWRHFEVERRLLLLGGEPLRVRLMELRKSGLKTEPAFWSALSGNGDPYAGMLTLYDCSDDALRQLLRATGFIATA